MKTLLPALLTASSLLLGAAGDPPAQPADPRNTAARADAGGPAAHPMAPTQKITTFLWYDDDAEEAIRFYGSIFPDSKVLSESRWGDGGPLPKGTLMTARFQLAGQEFMALNGGPMYPFTEAISLLVACETQAEIDRLWDALGAGGQPGRCGWLKDKYGLSWQVVPTVLAELLQDPDPVKAKRVAEAMLQMTVLDIRRLEQARDQS